MYAHYFPSWEKCLNLRLWTCGGRGFGARGVDDDRLHSGGCLRFLIRGKLPRYIHYYIIRSASDNINDGRVYRHRQVIIV